MRFSLQSFLHVSGPTRSQFFFSQLDLIFVVLFVFRTELKLESLEDAVVLEAVEEDILSDKHGCPAYVSPEILK